MMARAMGDPLAFAHFRFVFVWEIQDEVGSQSIIDGRGDTCASRDRQVQTKVSFVRSICLLAASVLLVFSRADCDPLRFDAPLLVGTMGSTDITEASGLAVSWRNPGVLWTHNDGNRDSIFAIALNGELLGRFHLNKSVDDLEDIAVGPGPNSSLSYLYAADIGSNDASRGKVKVYRVAEPAVTVGQAPVKADFTDVESFTLDYPGEHYDAEALLVDPIAREIFVVTKEDSGAHLFRARIDELVAGETTELEPVGTVAFAKASGGAVSKDGTLVGLRREDQGVIWLRAPGENIAQTLQRAPAVLPVVGPPTEPNGEGFSFLLDGSGYYTSSEGTNSPIYYIPRVAGSGPVQFTGQVRVIGSSIQMQFTACAGTSLALQRSNDLRQWADVKTLTGTGSVQTVEDAATPRAAFYRLRSF